MPGHDPTMSRKLPEAVEKVVQTINSGTHPSRIDPVEGTLRRRQSLDSRDDWEQISGSGEPFYVHTPSGFAFVLDTEGHAAPIGPDEMENLPTTMLAYYRAVNGQETPLGLIDPDPFKEIAKTCNSYEGKLDKDAVLNRIAPCDCEDGNDTDEVADAITEAGQNVIEATAEVENREAVMDAGADPEDGSPWVRDIHIDRAEDLITVEVKWPLTDTYTIVYDIRDESIVSRSEIAMPDAVVSDTMFNQANKARELADKWLVNNTRYQPDSYSA